MFNEFLKIKPTKKLINKILISGIIGKNIPVIKNTKTPINIKYLMLLANKLSSAGFTKIVVVCAFSNFNLDKKLIKLKNIEFKIYSFPDYMFNIKKEDKFAEIYLNNNQRIIIKQTPKFKKISSILIDMNKRENCFSADKVILLNDLDEVFINKIRDKGVSLTVSLNQKKLGEQVAVWLFDDKGLVVQKEILQIN